MDWNLLAIAALLTLSGLYFLEGALRRAPAMEAPVATVLPPRNAVERAWRAEPLAVFMRQLLAVRRRRPLRW
ncbi:MAG: hypothetical protein GX970_13570 [Phyllobacteriaceae bacterium]|nr:hypothetical protein [Phyllobacteriaceae bacterium]